MKKLLTVLIAMTTLVVFGVSSSMAAEPAAVIKDFECFISPPASGVPVTLTTKDRSQQVQAASGNVTLTCHFKFDPKVYKVKAQKHDKFTCGTKWGITTNSKSVTAPGGTVSLTCQIKQPKPDAKPPKK